MDNRDALPAWLARVVRALDAANLAFFLVWLAQPRHSSLGHACLWSVIAWCFLRCGLEFPRAKAKPS